MSALLKVRAITISLALSGLAACGGGGGNSAPAPIPPDPGPVLKIGADQSGNGTPGDPITRLATPTEFRPTAHQGLEIVSPGSLTPEANPSLLFERTTTGFDMTTTPGVTQFDARPNSRNLDGTNQYDSCVSNPSCIGSGVGLQPFKVAFNGGTSSTLDYTTYGRWTSIRTVITYTFGVFATGIPTTSAQMPTTGSGTFNGGATGFVVREATGNGGSALSFNGSASLSANFGARTLTGTVNAITAEVVNTGAAAGTLGSIAFTGSINGAAFSGTAIGNALLGATADLGGAAGTFGGQFYGPSAQEAAGSFALSKQDLTVIGSFGVRR